MVTPPLVEMALECFYLSLSAYAIKLARSHFTLSQHSDSKLASRVDSLFNERESALQPPLLVLG